MNTLKKLILAISIVFGICFVVNSENTAIIQAPAVTWNYSAPCNIDGFNLYYKPVDCATTNVTKTHIYSSLYNAGSTNFIKYFDSLNPNTIYLMTVTATKLNLESQVSNFIFFTNLIDTPIYPATVITHYLGRDIISLKILPYNGVTVWVTLRGYNRWHIIGHVFANKYGNILIEEPSYNQNKLYSFIPDSQQHLP